MSIRKVTKVTASNLIVTTTNGKFYWDISDHLIAFCGGCGGEQFTYCEKEGGMVRVCCNRCHRLLFKVRECQ